MFGISKILKIWSLRIFKNSENHNLDKFVDR